MSRILLHWAADGSFHWMAEPGISIVCVDEMAPSDRVYHGSGDAFPETIDAVIAGADPIDAANANGRPQ